MSSAARPFSALSASVSSRPPAPSMLPRPARASLGRPPANGVQVNGTGNGVLPNEVTRANAFMARNAFFNPQPMRSPSPESLAVANESIAPSKPSSGRHSAARLPTPPRDESEEAEESQPSQSSSAHIEESTNYEADVSKKNGRDVADVSGASVSDNEELGYSIFNPPASKSLSVKKTTKRLTPDSGETSPPQTMRESTRKSTRTKSDVNLENGDLESDQGSQRKKLRVSVPGGFEDDEEREQTELPSPTSASVGRGHGRGASVSSTGAARPTQTPAKRSTRKRAASPVTADEDEDIDSHPISIPGTLFTSDDEINAFASHGRSKGKGKANEELDELAPLPSSQSIMAQSTRGSKKKAASPAPAAGGRTPRRQTRSLRGDSVEPDPDLENGTRSVRRSSRLTDASPQKKSASASTARPKKSTRTSAAVGATATGRGATKRR